MKILVITSNIGKTAPGIVFERLIYGLSCEHHVDVVTSNYNPSIDLSKVDNIFEIKRKELHPRIFKLLISIFRISPIDKIWVKKVIKKIKLGSGNDYDIIFSFISFHHYAALHAGVSLCKISATKLAVYSVDAIPAPIGWSKNDGYFRGVKRMMRKELQHVNFFFSANELMLNYQRESSNLERNIVTGVIYNPSNVEEGYFSESDSDSTVFLYTGGIYGKRKPEYILNAFKELLRTHPNSILEFVGTKIPDEAFNLFSSEERQKIKIYGFTTDLHPFYKRSAALIDIDADQNDDIYLSSKMTNYITVNRPIICETGKKSPSSEIFRNIPSILQCGHDSTELAEAMRRVIEQKGTFDFNDRKEVIELFSLESIVTKLNKILS